MIAHSSAGHFLLSLLAFSLLNETTKEEVHSCVRCTAVCGAQLCGGAQLDVVVLGIGAQLCVVVHNWILLYSCVCGAQLCVMVQVVFGAQLGIGVQLYMVAHSCV